jgi:hypothetical protein
MAKYLVTQTWPKILKLSLSHHTVARRMAPMSGHVVGKVSDIVKKCCYFSLCLDETTDQTNFLFLFILSKVTFQLKKKLLNLCSLKGTTTGIDIYEAVQTTVDKFGGFDKCSFIVMDGAQAIVSHRIGLSGLRNKNEANCPILYCIIHEESLCGQTIKEQCNQNCGKSNKSNLRWQ